MARESVGVLIPRSPNVNLTQFSPSSMSASTLVSLTLSALDADLADEAVLEADTTNAAALALYARLGFVRDKRLGRYYLNGSDAFRLKRWFERGREKQARGLLGTPAIVGIDLEEPANGDVV